MSWSIVDVVSASLAFPRIVSLSLDSVSSHEVIHVIGKSTTHVPRFIGVLELVTVIVTARCLLGLPSCLRLSLFSLERFLHENLILRGG